MYSNILRSFYVILSTAVFISPKPDARQISTIGQTIRVQKWEKEFNGFLTVEFGWEIGDDGGRGGNGMFPRLWPRLLEMKFCLRFRESSEISEREVKNMNI